VRGRQLEYLIVSSIPFVFGYIYGSKGAGAVSSGEVFPQTTEIWPIQQGKLFLDLITVKDR